MDLTIGQKPPGFRLNKRFRNDIFKKGSAIT